MRLLGRFLVAVSFPAVLLGLSVRAVMSNLFLRIEYARPGFPADDFGFSTDERLLYGSYGVDYLSNGASSSYLGNLRFPDLRPVFTEQEVSHMNDVKSVLSTGLTVTGVWGLIVLGLILFLMFKGHRRTVLEGIRWGARLTLALCALLALAALFAWQQFFAWVHSLFFANGTWTFDVSDTLIRLYPEQFWMDAALTIGAIILLTCLICLVVVRKLLRSAPKNPSSPQNV